MTSPVPSAITHADEVRSTALHACFSAICGRGRTLGYGPASAIVSANTIRQEHDYTEADGTLRRYTLLVSVSVHADPAAGS